MFISPIKFIYNIEERYFPLTCFNIVQGLYYISNLGNIIDNNGNIIPQYLHNNGDSEGYRCISLLTTNGTKKFLVHRLVAATFIIGNTLEQKQVNHIDSVRYHNDVYNLEWSSPIENTRHAMNYGSFQFCEDRYNAKFTNEEVEIICKLLLEGKSYKDILEYIGIEDTYNNRDLIGFIKRGISYTSITNKYNFSNISYNFSNYSNNDIEKICFYIQQGKDYKYIANIFGVDLSTRRQRKTYSEFISRIRNRKTFKEISQRYIW